ncbi:MAG: biotin transporter BioY [Gemmatimonadota bacterium]|nr:biotin transporter BioY [Gemmatimonadota bacterium]
MNPEIGPVGSHGPAGTGVVAPRDRERPGLVVARRTLAVGLGALVVALAAQVVVPIPFSPVPMTLQPLAVLAVGGLLGAAGGLSALVLYLLLGILGLPVFAAGGSGAWHLLGPTGGYLLAFPIAAAVTGALVRPVTASSGSVNGWAVIRVLMSCAIGMVIIHAGGVAQLALLGGNPSVAFRVGFVPFLTGDLLKVGLAAALILAAGPKIRSLL